MAKRTDVFTKAKRSEVMSKIRDKGTEAEHVHPERLHGRALRDRAN